MKQFILSKSALIVFFIIYSINILAQPRVILTVDESLSTLDLGSIIVNNNLSGAPQFFCVEVIPVNSNNLVTMEGKFEWQSPESNIYELVGSFITQPFTARRICNNQIGQNDIRLQSWESNSDIIAETRRRGKLTGRYRLSVRASENGVYSGWEENILEFVNPAQTLNIIRPEIDQEYDPGNVIAEWTSVPACEYEITANIRTSGTQSLEEALSRGNPLINNVNVGTVTSINLRTILGREWQGGDEIVLQVAAIPGNGTKLYSNIVNFKIVEGNRRPDRMTINDITRLLELLGNQALASILSGENFIISDITNEDGSTMTLSELTSLINFLQGNLSNVLNIQFNRH